MDCTLCGKSFRPRRWNNDTWKSVQVRYVEQSSNRSPWENSNKSQLVKPILLKPTVLERGQSRLPQYEVSDIEEQYFWIYFKNNIRHFSRRNWRNLGHPIFYSYDHSFGKMSMFLISPWGGAYFYPIRSKIFQVFKISFYDKPYIIQIWNQDEHLKSVRSKFFLFTFEVLISKMTNQTIFMTILVNLTTFEYGSIGPLWSLKKLTWISISVRKV